MLYTELTSFFFVVSVVKVEKNPSSQLKRALSEGEKDGVKVEREGKRPKVELEAQLELKITAKKANSLLKLEKVCNALFNIPFFISPITCTLDIYSHGHALYRRAQKPS